jgi:hypothetical protein
LTLFGDVVVVATGGFFLPLAVDAHLLRLAAFASFTEACAA